MRPADDELAGIAAGRSDAPLFIYGGTVRMRGRGEDRTPLPDAPELYLVVVKPAAGVSTALAYAELDKNLCREHRGATEAAGMAVREGDRAKLLAQLWNEFHVVLTGPG